MSVYFPPTTRQSDGHGWNAAARMWSRTFAVAGNTVPAGTAVP